MSEAVPEARARARVAARPGLGRGWEEPGTRGEAGRAGGCRERGRDLRAGEGEAAGREEGEGVRSGACRGLRGGDSRTGSRRRAQGARSGDSPSRRLRRGRTDGRRCVLEAPGHVQPKLPEKTLEPLGECPRPERRPSPGTSSQPPAPVPSPPGPHGRAPVAPGKRAGRARERRRRGKGPRPELPHVHLSWGWATGSPERWP